MAATIEQIMGGLETRLATISGLRTKDIAPDNPPVPCAFPLVPPINYRETFGRGQYSLNFRIAVLVSASLDRIGQFKLASYANPRGATSIITAIEGDKTLGGIVSDTVVDTFDPDGLQEVGLIGYYGGTFSVRVIASGV
jgi:hypothetical protein